MMCKSISDAMRFQAPNVTLYQLCKLFCTNTSPDKIVQTSIDNLPADNCAIHIRADKTPVGQRARRYNAPTVSIVVVGEERDTCDVILQRRNNTIVRVAEAHRSYDELQYLIIFWQGQSGYHFNIKQTNPDTVTCQQLNKKKYQPLLLFNPHNDASKRNKLYSAIPSTVSPIRGRHACENVIWTSPLHSVKSKIVALRGVHSFTRCGCEWWKHQRHW